MRSLPNVLLPLKIKRLNIIILLGLVATIGILIAQLVWTFQAYKLEERKFAQKANVALTEVARKITEDNGNELFVQGLIQKVSNDFYVVNVNDYIQPEFLEYYLKTELTRFNFTTDFEYAIYDCENDEMMYGKYISFQESELENKKIEFPKYDGFIYYFAIRFPNEKGYLVGSLQFWFILSGALILILIIYSYSIYSLFQQKKYSDLQRDFINNMTHEFKTPLSSILLASNYISEQNQIKQDPKLSKYTSVIISQGKKLNSHIESILNIVKSGQGALSLKTTNIPLKTTIQSIAETYQVKHEKLDIQVKVGKDQIIVGDRFHFENIVQNLLDNSIKYSDENPRVMIESQQTSKGLQLNFSDNGIGVSPKNLGSIFDKFYRINDNLNFEVSGFGLGLFYVKMTANQHNWKVWATNNPTKGLTISFLFPKE